MGRYAIFVDAGYFFTQSAQILSGNTSKSRSELSILDAKKLRDLFVEQAEVVLDNKKLLRIYWYDGVKNSLTAMQQIICETDDIQLRAGKINGKGEQKGVDSLIVTDLIELATNHAVIDALVVTGDSDLAIGISIAQKKGVRVAVMGVRDEKTRVRHNQSGEITSIADRVVLIDGSHLTDVISYCKPKEGKSNTTPEKVAPEKQTVVEGGANLEAVVSSFLKSHPKVNKSVLDNANTIDKETDKLFLFYICQALGQTKLESKQKISARELLRGHLKKIN